jgi:hypothetical protein
MEDDALLCNAYSWGLNDDWLVNLPDLNLELAEVEAEVSSIVGPWAPGSPARVGSWLKLQIG